MSESVYVGLDVAKATLDVAVRPSGESWQVPNDDAGVTGLVVRLRALGPALIVCEATGGFERIALKLRGAAAAIKTDPFPFRRAPHSVSFKRWLGSAVKAFEWRPG